MSPLNEEKIGWGSNIRHKIHNGDNYCPECGHDGYVRGKNCSECGFPEHPDYDDEMSVIIGESMDDNV